MKGDRGELNIIMIVFNLIFLYLLIRIVRVVSDYKLNNDEKIKKLKTLFKYGYNKKDN